MIVDCISDLHGNYPELEGGDLLIVAGDLTDNGTQEGFFSFFDWLHEQDYVNKILIAGNHDQRMQDEDYKGPEGVMKDSFIYLCDSGTEVEWFETEDTKWGARHLDGCRHLKLKIWGSPWTRRSASPNSKYTAFAVDTEEELAEKWALIPDDTDILITHKPPYGILDQVENYYTGKIENIGSISLKNHVSAHPKINLHVFGHIHKWGGRMVDTCTTRFVNASHVDECFDPINKPVRIVL